MSKRNSLVNDMTQGPLGRQILLFSLPLILGNLLDTLYNLVDMAIVGQFVGSAGLSAVSTAGHITMLLYCLGIGFGNGGQILIAQQVGARDETAVRTTIRTVFTALILLALTVSTLGLLGSRTLLRLLNTPAEAWSDAVQYMTWCCLGIPFSYVSGGTSALMRGMGDSRRPTVFVAVAAVSNVILDLVFVAGLGLRAKGAAMATALAQCLGCICCLTYLYRNRDRFGFDFRLKSFRMEKQTLKTVVKLAAPLAVQVIAINVSMMVVNAWINAYGVIASAVSGVGTKLYSLFSIVTSAMQSAAATFSGQNLGARRLDRIRRGMFVTLSSCMVFWFAALAVCLLLPRQLFGLFTTDAAVLDMASVYMFIQIFMYLGFALMAPPLGFLNGIGHVNLNLAIALADGVVTRIGLSWLLSRVAGLGLMGCWWGQTLAGFVSIVWGWLYYFFGKWEKRNALMSPGGSLQNADTGTITGG